MMRFRPLGVFPAVRSSVERGKASAKTSRGRFLRHEGASSSSRNLTVKFGGLTAVSALDLTVNEGQITSIIGPNGAGKTTVFNAITGIHDPTRARFSFWGAMSGVRSPAARFSGSAGFSLFVALGSLVCTHCVGLWETAITANYRFMEAFPWGKSIGDFFSYFGDHAGSSFVSFVAGALVGGAGAWFVWQRQPPRPHVITHQGICRTFQNIRLFRDMTVHENVLAGMDLHMKSRPWRSVFGSLRLTGEDREASERAFEILEFCSLRGHEGQLAGSLPYGDQRRLEIARALATRPKLLLLDEPAAGMNPAETVALMSLIGKIRDRGVTVLLIEHDMRVVMGDLRPDRGARLRDQDREGTPAEVRANPACHRGLSGKRGDGVDDRCSMCPVASGMWRMAVNDGKSSSPSIIYTPVMAPIEVLKGVSLEVRLGEIVTVIRRKWRGEIHHAHVRLGDQPRALGVDRVRRREHHEPPAHEVVGLGISQAPKDGRYFRV